MTHREDTSYYRKSQYVKRFQQSNDFSKIQVDNSPLEDANYTINIYEKLNPSLGKKENVMRAITTGDVAKMREISDFFFKVCGIYSRLCRYIAKMYRFDWYVIPNISTDKPNIDKINRDFYKVLGTLEDFNPKKQLGDIALKVVRYGAFYGYKVYNGSEVAIQELPSNYCRSRFSVNGKPVVEFLMQYFDDAFKDEKTRERILKVFPKDFQKGYRLYKKGKLPPDTQGDKPGWYLLDTENAFRICLDNEEQPPFISVIPAIIDLEMAQDLNKKKMEQELLKIILQKMPLDKNGDLLFDTTEMKQLHAGAVKMLGRVLGIKVLTTVADVNVKDMAENRASSATDDLIRMERAVFNEAGVSQRQFNTDGNLALEKSTINDEDMFLDIIEQFQLLLNNLIKPYNKNKKVQYQVYILKTTGYNYEKLSKLYQDQTKLGYSKMLPQIALGLSQRNILQTLKFENEILGLPTMLIPPLTSNTINSDSLEKMSGGGRPELPNDEKSEKTLANIESSS